MGFKVKKRPSPLMAALGGFVQGATAGVNTYLQKALEQKMLQGEKDEETYKEQVDAFGNYVKGIKNPMDKVVGEGLYLDIQMGNKPLEAGLAWQQNVGASAFTTPKEGDSQTDTELRGKIAKSVKDIGLEPTKAVYGDELVNKHFPQGRFPKEDVKDTSAGQATVYLMMARDARAKGNKVAQLDAETNYIEFKTGKKVYNSIAELEQADERFKTIKIPGQNFVQSPQVRDAYIKEQILKNPSEFDFIVHDEPFVKDSDLAILISLLSKE